MDAGPGPAHAADSVVLVEMQRKHALDRFRAADNAVLVATDVAARGLDIKDVRCVRAWVYACLP
eukprot:1140208-Pelagomonas_calceolata.AAC.2